MSKIGLRLEACGLGMKRYFFYYLNFLFIAAAFNFGCNGDEDSGDDNDSKPSEEETGDDEIDIGAITAGQWSLNTFAYQLQYVDLNELSASGYELFVIDYSRDGSDETAFTASEVETLKESPSGKKIVVSYMSIGEAEDYRFYWKDEWSDNPPGWLDEENPDWEGNYKVRYWQDEWKDIVFGSDNSYLDKIINAGFDGVYLDIIDGYYYWEEKGRETAFDEMVAFVIEIANYARKVKGKSGFLVIPQNAAELLEDPEYRKVISAIGAEDTWFNGDDLQDSEHTDYVLPFFRMLKEEGKPVLTIDYTTTSETHAAFCQKALEEGFVPYFGPRELDTITLCCPCR